MSDKQKVLLEIANTYNATIWDTCKETWHFILAQEQEVQEQYFSTFLREISLEDVGITNLQHYFSKEATSRIRNDINQLGNRIVENLVQQRIPEEMFYKSLWSKICDDTLLPDQTAQTAFLACLWIDPRIPYYQVEEGCTMDNDEFDRLREKIWPTLKKVYFILSIQLTQKTQRASLLMKLADEIEDEQERIVFWAYVIAVLRGNSHQAKSSSSSDKSS